MVDMAHIAGLVAAGVHPSPVPYADVTTTTTHKTLRGPRGGLILSNDEEIAKLINKAIFPGTQGGPLMHTITAKAVCFGEALKPEFKAYAEQIIKNTATLAKGLLDEGFKLVSGGKILFLKASGCYSRSSKSDSTRYEGLLDIKGDCVLVAGNSNLVKKMLSLLTRINLHTCEVDEHKVVVRTS